MSKRTYLPGAVATVCLAFALPCLCQQFLFTTDIPLNTSGGWRTPNQILLYEPSGTITVAFDGPSFGMPPHVHITAVASVPQGGILFAADAPFTLGGPTYLPSDVLLYSGGGVSLYASGSALGLPASTVISTSAWVASPSAARRASSGPALSVTKRIGMPVSSV